MDINIPPCGWYCNKMEQFAHCTAFPYENLDMLWGIPFH